MGWSTEDEIRLIGEAVRATREGLGLTQEKAAKSAGVSRGQLAALERGENISIKLLLKIARSLALAVTIGPRTDAGDGAQISNGRQGLNLLELIQSLDVVATLVAHLRGVATRAIVPASGQGQLNDTSVLRDFLDKHGRDDAGVDRIARAILGLSEGVPVGSADPRPAAEQPPEAEKRHARKTRRREA